MKNPLNKRLPRELRQDFGKYVVIFAFLTMLIALVSGFLVATDSCEKSYYEGLEKYRVEHGHLTFDKQPDKQLLADIEEKADLTFYDLPYLNLLSDQDHKIRVYENRNDINLPCIMEGKLPQKKNDIAIDRLFAENNDYAIGDTMTLAGHKFTICGTVALPDYSVLFEKPTDVMFNASDFSIALMTPVGFEQFGAAKVVHSVAWRYNGDFDRYDKKESAARSEDLLKVLETALTDYNEAQVEDTIRAGKLILLSDMLKKIAGDPATGDSLDVFKSEAGKTALLEQINRGLAAESVDLSKTLGGGKKEVILTMADLDTALDATEADITAAKDTVDTLDERLIGMTDYAPQYKNQAINFAIDDIGADTVMFLVFDYLVTALIAFIFALIITSTIYNEAAVIGTLRASGYSKAELVRHYMVLPMTVTLIAAVVGNVLGYTLLKDNMAELYYHSYSLGTYETIWNADAFIMTTFVPLVLMFVINLVVLLRKLSLSPIRFLRRDLRKKSKKRAFRLNKHIPFLHRFRLRVIFQNLPNYAALLVGILLGGILMVFSLMFIPMLDDYRDLLIESRLCDHQYILKDEADAVDEDGVERFLLSTLKTDERGIIEDEVSIYGVQKDSKVVPNVPKQGEVLVSASYGEKYHLSPGDTISLKDPYSDKHYCFTVAGRTHHYVTMAVFVNDAAFKKQFKKTDYVTGLFSDHKLNIDEDRVARDITVQDVTRMSDQLIDSMSRAMGVFRVFGVILFLLLMYLLSKQIIEKNVNTISMAKILGFSDKEIGGIYIIATGFVVVASLFLACPTAYFSLRAIFNGYLYTKMTGYFPFAVPDGIYAQMIGLGVLCYVVVMAVQLRKIKRISKVDVLKNVE